MKKTVIITGASQGIGLALTQKMLDEGYTVIGTSRHGVIDAVQHDNLHAMTLDITDMKSIQAFSEAVKAEFNTVNMLVDNVGVGPDLGDTHPDTHTFETTFKVNVNGTVFLTEAIIPMLQKEGKIVILSSRMGSIAVTETSDSVAYRMSKSALNMYTKLLSNRLVGEISVAAVDPGWVKTEIRLSNLKNAPLTPQESAGNIYEFISSNFKTGIYWDSKNKTTHNW